MVAIIVVAISEIPLAGPVLIEWASVSRLDRTGSKLLLSVTAHVEGLDTHQNSQFRGLRTIRHLAKDRQNGLIEVLPDG